MVNQGREKRGREVSRERERMKRSCPGIEEEERMFIESPVCARNIAAIHL